MSIFCVAPPVLSPQMQLKDLKETCEFPACPAPRVGAKQTANAFSTFYNKPEYLL